MTYLSLSRRKLLTLGGAGMFLPSFTMPLEATGFYRQPLPQWIQSNRIVGQGWQNRQSSSIYFSQDRRKVLCAKWSLKTKIVTDFFYIPDPVNQLMNDFFRAYEVRGSEDLNTNPSYVEDIIWPGRRLLEEKIWTEFYGAADEFWNILFNEDREDRINLKIPEYTPIIWIQPTNDTPPEDQEADLDMENDDDLVSLIENMLENQIPMAGVNLNTRLLTKNLPHDKNVWIAKLKPTLRPQYKYIYFRILTAKLRK